MFSQRNIEVNSGYFHFAFITSIPSYFSLYSSSWYICFVYTYMMAVLSCIVWNDLPVLDLTGRVSYSFLYVHLMMHVKFLFEFFCSPRVLMLFRGWKLMRWYLLMIGSKIILTGQRLVFNFYHGYAFLILFVFEVSCVPFVLLYCYLLVVWSCTLAEWRRGWLWCKSTRSFGTG